MLIFKSFLVQVGNFISYGVCKLAFIIASLEKGGEPPLGGGGIFFVATAASRFHKELRFFFSLLKRKKEAKKEKSSCCTCTTRSSITRRLHKRFSPTKIHRKMNHKKQRQFPDAVFVFSDAVHAFRIPGVKSFLSLCLIISIITRAIITEQMSAIGWAKIRPSSPTNALAINSTGRKTNP